MRALTSFSSVGLVVATPALLLGVFGGVAWGDAGASALAVKVADPSAVSFDMTALGRASHQLKISIANSGREPLPLVPLAFRFRPVKDGVAFACDEPTGTPSEDRWPATLEPSSSFTLSREVSCETPLPGRYEVEVRGRPRKGTESEERAFGTFALTIEPGANPPVRLPWDGNIHASASVTKEMRPTKDPNKARVIIAMTNGTKTGATLSAVHATFHVTRRGMKLAPCADRQVELSFGGSLAAGRTQSVVATLGCELSQEAIYDVDVTIANAGGARVKLASQAIRVGVLPPPPPRPEDTGQAKIQGGM